MAQRNRQNKILGVAIGERSLVVAEASRVGETPRVTLAASFTYPQGAGLDKPEHLGPALAAFLKDKGFTARQVVVGVPARWVLSKTKEVPPADPSVVAEALRLQVEGEFSQELRDLTFDYAGETSPADSETVLLVAIQGRHLDEIKALAKAAKLQLSGVTPVGCVLGAVTAVAAGKPRQAMVVSVGPGGVELAALDGPGSPRVLRHLGASAAPPAMLAGEFRRATFAVSGFSGGSSVADAPAGGTSFGGGAVNGNGKNGRHGPALVLWDTSALSDASRRALSDAAGGAKLEQGDLQSLGVTPGLSAGAPDIAGAAAVAIAALSDEPLPADFIHSKLAEPRRIGLPRQTVVLAIAGTVALLLIVLALLDLKSKGRQLAELDELAVSRKNEIKDNKAFVDRLSYARKYHSDNPRYVACMNDLMARIPQTSPPIYLTSFTMREPSGSALTAVGSDGRRMPPGAVIGSLTGKAESERQAREVADALKAKGGPFGNVVMSWSQDTNSRSITFRIQNFWHVAKPLAKPPAAPSRGPAQPATPARR